MEAPRTQLALIAFVEVLVMGLWFSASAVVPSLRVEWGISRTAATWLTASVQLGFVCGAVGSVLLNLADRIRPPKLIAISAVAGAAATLAFALFAHGLASAVPLRFATGVALAGVYPVGMKLMASWFKRGRGLALGTLVGALTVGSGLPQLINGVTRLPPRGVLAVGASLALFGAAVAALLLRAGPYLAPTPPLEPRYIVTMFRDRGQRLINFGYFGHMWELYAMWTWLPTFIAASYTAWGHHSGTRLAVGLTAFAAIGVAGALGCLAGGWLGDRHGQARVTIAAMLTSAICCVLAAVVYGGTPLVLVPLLLIWGAAVIADSAQFSAALTAAADQRYVGTALTAQMAIGFLLTVATIQALPVLVSALGWRATLPLLAIGPFAGALAMSLLRREAKQSLSVPIAIREKGVR